MKSVFLIVAAIACLWATTGVSSKDSDQPNAKSAVETIRQLEQERNGAILRGDFSALERMTADDYTFVTLRGEMLAKADIIRNFHSGAAKYQSREISDLNIRIYGNSAVVTGRAIQKGEEHGTDYSGDYWFTRVYVYEGGRWLIVGGNHSPKRRQFAKLVELMRFVVRLYHESPMTSLSG